MIKDAKLEYLNINIFICMLYRKMLGKLVCSMFLQFTIDINNSKLNNHYFLRKKDLILYYQIISNSKIFSFYQFHYSHITLCKKNYFSKETT